MWKCARAACLTGTVVRLGEVLGVGLTMSRREDVTKQIATVLIAQRKIDSAPSETGISTLPFDSGSVAPVTSDLL